MLRQGTYSAVGSANLFTQPLWHSNLFGPLSRLSAFLMWTMVLLYRNSILSRFIWHVECVWQDHSSSIAPIDFSPLALPYIRSIGLIPAHFSSPKEHLSKSSFYALFFIAFHRPKRPIAIWNEPIPIKSRGWYSMTLCTSFRLDLYGSPRESSSSVVFLPFSRDLGIHEMLSFLIPKLSMTSIDLWELFIEKNSFTKLSLAFSPFFFTCHHLIFVI